MTTFKSTLKIFSFVALVFAFASIAQAQATRTWVSGVGDDANPCSRTAPCKTFAGAISKTATNGEINCLDPAGYGAVTITKSLTIDCEDTQGSILASLVNGVIVNSSTAHVKLRGLSINGAGNGINCVRVIAAASVVLDEVVCANFSQHGVSVENSSGAIGGRRSAAARICSSWSAESTPTITWLTELDNANPMQASRAVTSSTAPAA